MHVCPGRTRRVNMYEGRQRYVSSPFFHLRSCYILIPDAHDPNPAVISRQFREMSRARIESLLASFPKLIPTNTQHTSVETPDVRYVYQPLEDLYIVLITNKASNILQDIETLHLFARVVSDMCRSADQREILKNSFELLGAFDEIVSLGYREMVNLMQIRSVLEMESHEEKIQEIIARVCLLYLLLYRTSLPPLTSLPSTLPITFPSLVTPPPGMGLMLYTEQRSRSERRTQTPRQTTRNATPRTTKTRRRRHGRWHQLQRRLRFRHGRGILRRLRPRPPTLRRALASTAYRFACTVLVEGTSV